MHVERIQIEEGFLDGLDLSLEPGLNVIIGARGTGKTSLIELLRFCLGVKGYTAESSRRSTEHAMSVLGSGQVVVTLRDEEKKIVVSRAAQDPQPRVSASFAPPIIFSQTEIESVGLQPSGRLRLIDGFAADFRRIEAEESEAVAAIRSLTSEIEASRREIEEIERQLSELPSVEEQIGQLEPSERQIGKISAEAATKAGQLEQLIKQSSQIVVSESFIERSRQSLARWQTALVSARQSTPQLETWTGDAATDPLIPCRASIARARKLLDDAIRESEAAATSTSESSENVRKERLRIEEKARQLRKEIDNLQAGAGAVARQGQQLRERQAQLKSLSKILQERRKAFEQLVVKRNISLDRLDAARDSRFQSRLSTARELGGLLGPKIRILVERSGQYEIFAAAIAEVLRGSGLKYSDLSSVLAERVSPRELLEAVDTNSYESIADASGISRDRAVRVVAQLREADLGQLATVIVDDNVLFQLLDGQDYKDMSDLSTGQRCTVVLPLILRHTDRVLVVDQPEDHIDNAFIVDTLIRALLARPKKGQIIFSTHNANIPVLGNAERVVQLGSDGRRGFIRVEAPLGDPRIVTAITTVMEGGAEAFQRRADFYRKFNK